MARATPTPSDAAPSTAEPGVEPERYRVIGLIGRGGMGVVVLAEDPRLGRTVALKAARRGTQHDERRKRRFLAEARATAQLEHPSIVPVYDVTETAEGELAFAMRYVDGRPLSEIFDRLRAGDEEAIAEHSQTELLLVFLKMCDATAYAHDRGVLHRDLKPDNVMLGRFGEVFVMDWGLAGVRADESAARPVTLAPEKRETAITRPGTIVGTPGYVAPEQVRGSNASVASEIFALGAILYEMLTLARAIPGELPAAILANTVVQPIVSPRERAPHREISRGLDRIVMRALAVAPEDRFASVGELRLALASEIRGAQVAALIRDHGTLVRADGSFESALGEIAEWRSPAAPDRAPATLEIVGAPEAARVRIARLHALGPLEREGAIEELDGRGGPVVLAPGALVVTVCAAGRCEVRSPLVLAPGEHRRLAIDAPSAAAIEPGFAVISEGAWSVDGHDASVRLPRFAIALDPVTVAEWREFLEDLRAREGYAAALARAPGPRGAPLWTVALERAEEGAELVDRRTGRSIDPRAPIAWIDPDDAEHYARWRAARSGRRMRLPTSIEWEVAASGGLGRPYVWGRGFDPAIVGEGEPPDVLPRWEPIERAPFDRSVFGLRAMTTGSREITSTPHPADATARVARGGAWQRSAEHCRIERIARVAPGRQDPIAGLRLVHDID